MYIGFCGVGLNTADLPYSRMGEQRGIIVMLANQSVGLSSSLESHSD